MVMSGILLYYHGLLIDLLLHRNQGKDCLEKSTKILLTNFLKSKVSFLIFASKNSPQG